MPELVQTMKLHILPGAEAAALFDELARRYADACNFVSQYIFNNGFPLNFMKVQKAVYQDVRAGFGLKSQMTISSFKTVTARYKTISEQMFRSPYKYQDEDGTWQYIPRTLEWLQKPVVFRRPQADLVRGRDYSFVRDGSLLSINTLKERVTVPFDLPECFQNYFDGTWDFGTAKLVSLKGEWYFHIPMTKRVPETFSREKPSHVVGIDRGLRFLAVSYDEAGTTRFMDGRAAKAKRDSFAHVRAGLQSKGTKSAKRALKRISGRENRWMSDVNHQLTKTLVRAYGSGTLFVLEDLTGVSFDEKNLGGRTKEQRQDTRSWPFYQFGQFLSYKAAAAGSSVIEVKPDYTSQRCPKCGRIHKANRHHDIHEYICDACGYRSNDDRVGAMNLQQLGAMYVSGDNHPRFGVRKTS